MKDDISFSGASEVCSRALKTGGQGSKGSHLDAKVSVGHAVDGPREDGVHVCLESGLLTPRGAKIAQGLNARHHSLIVDDVGDKNVDDLEPLSIALLKQRLNTQTYGAGPP